MVEVRILTVTPEEIGASSDLQAIMRSFAGTVETVPHAASLAPIPTDPRAVEADGLPADIAEHINSRASSDAHRDFVTQFVKEQLATGRAEVSIGHSIKRASGQTSYLMLHARGPRRFGAYAYVRPTNAGLTLRLPPDEAKGREYASPRKVPAAHKYAVMCPLRSEGALAEAIDLAEEALKRVTS